MWYVLQVRPRFEKFVEARLDEKKYEVFLPTYEVRRAWSDRAKTLTLPLFPGYVFCRFDVNHRLPILVTPGVRMIVGVGKAPVAVDEQEMIALRHMASAGMPVQPWPYLRVGEMVRVEKGALEGVSGIVVRAKGTDRLILSVTLLMRSVAVEIDRDAVKPLATPEEGSTNLHISRFSAGMGG